MSHPGSKIWKRCVSKWYINLVDKKFLLKWIIWQLYSKIQKDAKKSTLPSLGPNTSFQRFSPNIRFAVGNLKYRLVSLTFEQDPFNGAIKRKLNLFIFLIRSRKVVASTLFLYIDVSFIWYYHPLNKLLWPKLLFNAKQTDKIL